MTDAIEEPLEEVAGKALRESLGKLRTSPPAYLGGYAAAVTAAAYALAVARNQATSAPPTQVERPL